MKDYKLKLRNLRDSHTLGLSEAGRFRRYIQRGSRQRTPKAFCTSRFLTQHTGWFV